MLLNNITSQLYVGSSINFSLRLRHYLTNTKEVRIRLILQNIRDVGISNFTLMFYRIPPHLQERRLLLALEQYYILSLDPALNTLKVVNETPGGMRLSENNSIKKSVPIFVSIGSQLVYVFDSLNGVNNSAMSGFNASTNSILAHLSNGEPFLGVYQLSRVRPLEIRDGGLMTQAELMKHIEKLRLSLMVYTPPITIVRLSDNEMFNFINFNEARK